MSKYVPMMPVKSKGYISLKPTVSIEYIPFIRQPDGTYKQEQTPEPEGKLAVFAKPPPNVKYVPWRPKQGSKEYVPWTHEKAPVTAGSIPYENDLFAVEESGQGIPMTPGLISMQPTIIQGELIPYGEGIWKGRKERVIIPAKYPYPFQYVGFVDKTSIILRYNSNTKDRYGYFIFKSPAENQTVKLRVKIPGKTIEREGLIAPPPLEGMSYIKRDQLRESHRNKWPYPIDTNLFDNVTLEMDDGDEISIRSASIILNGEVILGLGDLLYFPDQSPRKRWDLSDLIRRTRLNRIGYDNLPSDLPDLSRELLYLAANDLAQAWDPRYCPWNFEENEPIEWCSEFFSWIISKATNGVIDPNPTRRSIHNEHIVEELFYKTYEPNMFLTAKNTRYEDLGDLIKSGFYVKINRSGHSTMFLRWVTRLGLPFNPPGYPVKFKKDGTNYFHGLGGNQSDKVKLSVYSITNKGQPEGSDPDDWPNIVWKYDPTLDDDEQPYIGAVAYQGWVDEETYNKEYDWKDILDGFGNTDINIIQRGK